MCDRTIKMKLNKGSILQEVNSNTNSIEFTVKGINTKQFGRHINLKFASKPKRDLPPDVKNQMEWVKKETNANKN